jgi:hypothetical protein
MAATPGKLLRDRFISVVSERLVRSAQTQQDVFGWVQEDRRISFITVEPLAKSGALVGAEFFDAFLDFSQTAVVTMVNQAVPFHFNQSVDSTTIAARANDVNQVIDLFFGLEIGIFEEGQALQAVV